MKLRQRVVAAIEAFHSGISSAEFARVKAEVDSTHSLVLKQHVEVLRALNSAREAHALSERYSIRLASALVLARSALEQGATLDVRVAGNGPTLKQVIDRALTGEWKA